MTVAFGLQPSLSYAQVKADSTEVEMIRPLDKVASALAKTDSIVADSLAADSTLIAVVDSLQDKKQDGGGLTAVVNYKSSDSLVFSMGNMAWLYGNSEVTYDDINLTAERIRLSLDSSLVHASGIPDSTAPEGSKMQIGAPVFKDKSGEYETRTIMYNFKTAKGYITDVVTQQGEGYVTGGTTKKMADNDIFMENGRYTTCDLHDCPHFYINLTKARVRPKKNIVTGPAYLVVADVPLPLAIPFGFFPFTKSYSSGVIMPSYGADQTRGLYLRDGGYYFAINDYMDLSLKGDLYTKGTWSLRGDTKYAWRYKFKGNVSFAYTKSVTGDKGMPDYTVGKSFKIGWSHSQDSRFNPNMSLQARVDFSTSGYNHSNTQSVSMKALTENTKSSSVSMSYRIPNSVWSFVADASVTQRLKDSTLDVRLPNLSISMSRIYPFKRKEKVGQDRWYEKIAMTYSARFSNSIVTKESEFKNKNLIKDWRNGIQHDASFSAPFTILKYITVNPSFNITDRMYSNKTVEYYDPSVQNRDGSFGSVVADTLYGFYNVFNYSSSLSLNTTLYGMYVPLPIFKNSKLVAVRHLMKPSISFSYTPDFGQPKYHAWDSYMVPDANEPTGFRKVDYTPFQKNLYGSVGHQKSGAISLSLVNNIEAKVRSDKDSTGFKKISIIDNLSTNISYNLAADSMNWSRYIPLSVGIKMGKNGSMNLQGQFDTYEYGLNSAGNPVAINRPRWRDGKFPRLKSTGYSYSYQLDNKKLAKLFGFGGGDKDDDNDSRNLDLDDDNMDLDDEVNDDLDPSYAKETQTKSAKKKSGKSGSTYDADGYWIWTVPWSLSLSYTMRYDYGKFDKTKMEYKHQIIHSATLNGSIKPTKGWDFRYNLSYDFNQKKVTFMSMSCTRDMHCWNLTANMTPLGRYANFYVCVAVKSSMLRDLKYEKRTVSGSNKIDWYD